MEKKLITRKDRIIKLEPLIIPEEEVIYEDWDIMDLFDFESDKEREETEKEEDGYIYEVAIIVEGGKWRQYGWDIPEGWGIERILSEHFIGKEPDLEELEKEYIYPKILTKEEIIEKGNLEALIEEIYNEIQNN